jgi:hypothetical protein
MPAVPTAIPDRDRIKSLIWERGYSVNEFARKIGRKPGSLWAITGSNPRPTSVTFIRQIARGLKVKPSEISDWTGDDIESEPEPKVPAA